MAHSGLVDPGRAKVQCHFGVPAAGAIVFLALLRRALFGTLGSSACNAPAFWMSR
jgi:hypothetical protein